MSFRSVLGSIIIFLATIGFIINLSLNGIAELQCNQGIIIFDDPNACMQNFFFGSLQPLINIGIGLVVFLFWLGVGLLIKGKQ